MKTVGQILKNCRLEKRISLEEVAEVLKIRKEFLRALEENDFSILPSYTSSVGFLKNYADFLGLSPDSLIAIFRRDFSKPNTFVHQKVKHIRINWGPKLMLILIITFSILGLGGYLGYQYFSFNKPPYIEVFSPLEGEKFFQDKVEIKGKTQPDAILTINDIPVFPSLEGEFRYELEIFPGENKIVVVAKNSLGKETKIERTIFYLDK